MVVGMDSPFLASSFAGVDVDRQVHGIWLMSEHSVRRIQRCGKGEMSEFEGRTETGWIGAGGRSGSGVG